jgi:cyclic pyranopterin phosphate synthase
MNEFRDRSRHESSPLDSGSGVAEETDRSLTETPLPSLTHVDSAGDFHMVDVGGKPVTERVAVASGHIRMEPSTLKAIQQNSLKKGDVIPVARVAGIQAAKRTSDLIPLCHPLPLSDIQVRVSVDEALPGLRVEGTVRTTARTGVEMEALTAVAVSLLTIYDMAKAVDRTMSISEIQLREKRGGMSGDFIADS